jgi:hypothetical protein
MTTDWFTTPPHLWNAETLNDLVGIPEGLRLEYKKGKEFFRPPRRGAQPEWNEDELRKELIETASAFLNSDGGYLLLGVQTREPAGGKDEVLVPVDAWRYSDSLDHFGVTLTEQGLSAMLRSNLSPSPDGISVSKLSIAVDGKPMQVFVVGVPRSNTGAHQSLVDFKYYRRSDSEDRPMADFEIKDVNSRRSGPLLYVPAYVTEGGADLQRFELEGLKGWRAVTRRQPYAEGASFHIGVALSNYGQGSALNARVDIGIPNWFSSASGRGRSGAFWTESPRMRATVGSFVRVVCREGASRWLLEAFQGEAIMKQGVSWTTVTFNGHASGAHPVWPTPDLEIDLGMQQVTARIATPDAPVPVLVPWRVLSESMSEQRGIFVIKFRPEAKPDIADHIRWHVELLQCPSGDMLWAGEHESRLFDEAKSIMGIS